ncbi:LysR family transcriptional regulator [Endozoicomonas arenosclerae]|uniref:LysR family transcriptional regulator n=1 Tax=Endozoicomonas arenosclerae TaxID=1633495 RepID=UPI00155F9DDB|nr:LysR family transcriptional regulator [Endozoicomonas arenosclerae]
MDISDLVVFVAVVEEGGITPAATRLNRVPSNVTARIKKLEQLLSRDLFIREKNRLRVSGAGELLLGHAKDLIKMREKVLEDMQLDVPAGLLKLGAIEMAAATHLVEPMVHFNNQYPDVELKLETAATGLLVDRVLRGELDLALASDPVEDPGLEVMPIFQETMTLVSEAQHKPIKTAADLGESPSIIAFSPYCSYRKRLDSWLESGSRLARAVEIPSYHALLGCVAAGMGVGMVPQAIVDIFPFQSSVKTHPLPARWAHSRTCLISIFQS